MQLGVSHPRQAIARRLSLRSIPIVIVAAIIASDARAQPSELRLCGMALESEDVDRGMVASLAASTASLQSCSGGARMDLVVRLRYRLRGAEARFDWLEGAPRARRCAERVLRQAMQAEADAADVEASPAGVVVAWWSSRPPSPHRIDLRESRGSSLGADVGHSTLRRSLGVRSAGTARWTDAHTRWLYAHTRVWMGCWPPRTRWDAAVRVTFDAAGAPHEVVAVLDDPFAARAIGVCLADRVAAIPANRVLANQRWRFDVTTGRSTVEIIDY